MKMVFYKETFGIGIAPYSGEDRDFRCLRFEVLEKMIVCFGSEKVYAKSFINSKAKNDFVARILFRTSTIDFGYIDYWGFAEFPNTVLDPMGFVDIVSTNAELERLQQALFYEEEEEEDVDAF